MEKNLDKVLDDVVNSENVTGCIVSDEQGLCLGIRGNASSDSCGILKSLADQAKKLDPTMDGGATVILENSEKQFIIKSNDKLVLSVYKNVVGSNQ